jgi:hypothetical protein
VPTASRFLQRFAVLTVLLGMLAFVGLIVTLFVVLDSPALRNASTPAVVHRPVVVKTARSESVIFTRPTPTPTARPTRHRR